MTVQKTFGDIKCGGLHKQFDTVFGYDFLQVYGLRFEYWLKFMTLLFETLEGLWLGKDSNGDMGVREVIVRSFP